MFNFNPKDWMEGFFFFFLLIFLLVQKSQNGVGTRSRAGFALPRLSSRGAGRAGQPLHRDKRNFCERNCQIHRDAVGAIFVRVIFRRPGMVRARGMERGAVSEGLHGCFCYGKAYSKQSTPMRLAFLCALKRTSGNYCAVGAYLCNDGGNENPLQ